MDSASIRVPYKNLKQAEVELMRLEESHRRSSEVDHSPNGISPSSSSSVHPPQHNMSMATLILSCTVAAGVQFGWALQLSLLTPYIQTLGIGHAFSSFIWLCGPITGLVILALKNREPTESINLNKETEGSCSNPSENSSDIKPSDRRTTPPPIDSHPNIITSRPLFPASHSNIRPPTHVAQLLFQGNNNNNNNNNNSSSARPDLQCHKIDPHQTVKEESFCNMFCGIDDQTGFWPWLEQHHFN